MNLLKLYPKKFRESYEKNIQNSGLKTTAEKHNAKSLVFALIISIISTGLFFYFKINVVFSFGIFIFVYLYFYFKLNLVASTRIKKMETIFPDVISLMASNLRAGITIDRSFLLSARPEFSPLDEEILKTGKDIATGKGVDIALMDMSKRIDSEKISKTITLIVSGLKAGGNVSDLLEQTSSNMKEKEFIEKRAASNILMYVIFIFFAVGIGAPLLFALSSTLVEIILELSANIPDVSVTQVNLPFTFNELSLTPEFVTYFAIVFLVVTDFISCFVIGAVNKGEGKAGLKFFVPLVAVSLGIFFLMKVILAGFLSGLFAAL